MSDRAKVQMLLTGSQECVHVMFYNQMGHSEFALSEAHLTRAETRAVIASLQALLDSSDEDEVRILLGDGRLVEFDEDA